MEQKTQDPSNPPMGRKTQDPSNPSMGRKTQDLNRRHRIFTDTGSSHTAVMGKYFGKIRPVKKGSSSVTGTVKKDLLKKKKIVSNKILQTNRSSLIGDTNPTGEDEKKEGTNDRGAD